MNIFTGIDYPSEIYKKVYKTIDELNFSLKYPSLTRFCPENKIKMQDVFNNGGLQTTFKEQIIEREQAIEYIKNNQYEEFLDKYFCNLKKIDDLYYSFLKSIAQIYRVEEVTIFTNKVNHNIGSDFWHRDGVGHRLKLFIPILLQGQPPATEFFKGTNKLSCRPFKWELERIGKINPNTHSHQDSIHNYYQDNYGQPESFSWGYNKVLIMDTNTVHRAANFHSGTEGSFRIFIIVEFMDRISSKLASKMRLGECDTLSNKKLIDVIIKNIG